MSLKTRVAFIITLISLIPNAVVMLLITAQFNNLSKSVIAALLAWLAVVVVVSGVFGFFLSRVLFRPMDTMTRQVRHYLSRSDRLRHVRLVSGPSEPTEIALLSSSFNELLQRIHTEQSRRDSFMATLMHDLRTPLLANNTLLKVIRDKDDLEKEQRILLVEKMIQENSALSDLVQQMVEAYKVERDELQIHPQNQALEDIVAKVLERVSSLAGERGIGLVCNGTARADVDARELERALYNLISNAVRYAKSEIHIQIFPNLIRLSDDGPGLPAPIEELAQAFNTQPIYIAGKTFSAGTGGLGLFIARRILELHGGKLITESSGPSGTVLLIYVGASTSAR